MEHNQTSIERSFCQQNRKIIYQVTAYDGRRIAAGERNRRLQALATMRMIRPDACEQPPDRVIVAHVYWRDIEASTPYDLRRRQRQRCRVGQ